MAVPPSTLAGLAALREALAAEVHGSIRAGLPASEAATERLREATATLSVATEAERKRKADAEAAHAAALAALADAGRTLSAVAAPAVLTSGAAAELARAKASAAAELRGAEALLKKGVAHTSRTEEADMLSAAKKSVRFAEDARMICAASALLERVKSLDKVRNP